MANIFIVRLPSAIDCDDYYEQKTDVWFLADVRGYAVFIKKLRAAIHSKRCVHLWPLADKECNMLLSILPPISANNASPKAKFSERFVFYKSKPWMELVISGNRAGYKLLISKIEGFVKNAKNGTLDHVHFDDLSRSQRWIVKRSVALNMRGPLKKWDLKQLRENGHDYLLKRKLPDTIPADLHYRFMSRGHSFSPVDASDGRYVEINTEKPSQYFSLK